MSTSTTPLSEAAVLATATNVTTESLERQLDTLSLKGEETHSEENDISEEGTATANVDGIKKEDIATAEGSQVKKIKHDKYLDDFNTSLAPFLKEAPKNLKNVCKIGEPWPGVNEVLDNVFGQSERSPKYSWEESLAIVRGLDGKTALNRYLSAVFENYVDCFAFKDTSPKDFHVKEGWANITWPIIKGALRVLGVNTRCWVQVAGEGICCPSSSTYAAGVGLAGSSQVYVAETSRLVNLDSDKENEVLEKVLRDMGDLVVNHIETKDSLLATTVYGSQTYENRTRFFAMDATTEFPLRELDWKMTIPLTKEEFVSMMPDCLRAALHFAQAVSNETKRRNPRRNHRAA